mgnify:CR=1 FL=1
MHVDIPQWLPQAYVRAVQAAGSPLSKEELAVACRDVLRRWSSDDRHYHGLQHLMDIAASVETLTPQMHRPELVRLAAWYHGVVFSTEAKDTYTRNGGEDEAASAEVAHEDLLRLGVPEDNARRVAELVRGIRSKCDPRSSDTAKLDAIDIDLLALRDAHMGTLAVEPQRYKKYIERVRKEYSHIPTVLFLRGRQEIIRHLLGRPALFITPLARQWEETTRENLQAESQRIAAKLEAMSEQDGAPATNERKAMAARVPEVEEDPRPTLVPHARILTPSSAQSPLSAVTPPYPASAPSPATGSFAAVQATEHGNGRQDGSGRGDAAHVRAAQSNAGQSRVGGGGRADAQGQVSGATQVSSLESCGERFSPGEKTPTDLSPEELKQLKRERLAAQVRKRIEDRHQAGRCAGDAQAGSGGALTEAGTVRAVGAAKPRSAEAGATESGKAETGGLRAANTRAADGLDAVASPRVPDGFKSANSQSPDAAPAEAGEWDNALGSSLSRLAEEDAAEQGGASGAESWRLAFPSGRHGYKVLSAATPEWVDDEEEAAAAQVSTSGMEREPDL